MPPLSSDNFSLSCDSAFFVSHKLKQIIWFLFISGQMGASFFRDMKIAGGACGANHSFVWTTEGDVYSFGWGSYAQILANAQKKGTRVFK